MFEYAETMTDDRMRITELLRLEGASGDHPVPPRCSQQAQLQQVAQGCSHLGFEYLQGWRLRSLSGQPVLLPDHPHHKKKLFLMYTWKFPILHFIPVASCPLSGQTRGNHPIRCSYTWMDSAGPAPVCPCPSCIGEPRTGRSTPDVTMIKN